MRKANKNQFTHNPRTNNDKYIKTLIKKGGRQKQKAIWAPLLSLLALTSTFQQNYHRDNNQLVVTPNEMVGLFFS